MGRCFNFLAFPDHPVGPNGGSMKIRLTKTSVEAAKPGPREYFLWDSTQRGFGVRIHPGGSKVYLFRYSGGRRGFTRKLTIGVHGDITSEEARVRAHRARGAVSDGKDPAALVAEQKAVPSLKAFSERYLEEHAVPHKRPASVTEDRRLFKRVILPRLGSLRLDKVTTGDIARLHHSRKGTPTDANRAVALLSHLFTFAEQRQVRPQGTNPCRGIKRFKEHKRSRFLADTELASLGKALAKSKESLFAIAAIRLLVLTGARRGEVLAAKWTDVDLARRVLRVPLPKEKKAKDIRLGPPRACRAQVSSPYRGKPVCYLRTKARSWSCWTRPYLGTNPCESGSRGTSLARFEAQLRFGCGV